MSEKETSIQEEIKRAEARLVGLTETALKNYRQVEISGGVIAGKRFAIGRNWMSIDGGPLFCAMISNGEVAITKSTLEHLTYPELKEKLSNQDVNGQSARKIMKSIQESIERINTVSDTLLNERMTIPQDCTELVIKGQPTTDKDMMKTFIKRVKDERARVNRISTDIHEKIDDMTG